ncbi:MAG: hypothetical protein KatS3mg009_0357 [Acidimicrobiia bacterium]|nr:MAG: hypothetical protein KatS3mg009_0357 [Acidimicrobiia bacterium]
MATIGPALGGTPSLFSVAFDLGTVGYRADEHLVAGEAERYAAAGAHRPDGRWDVTVAGRADFTTRVVVHRPADPGAADGTVVVEWLNVTGGLDVPAVWMATHRHLVRTGITWAGVSVQQVGVAGGGGVMQGLSLLEVDPGRYGSLHHPGDAHALGIFGAVGRALRDALPRLHGLRVDRMIAAGASQSAMYLTTYVNAIQPRDAVFDAFLLQGRAGRAAPVGGWDPAAVSLRDDDAAANRARLRGADRIRDDTGVPVIVVQSETDVFGRLASLPARQPDSDHFRWWEVAGAAHCDTYFLCAAPHDDGRLPVADLAALVDRAETSGLPAELPINAGPQMHYVMQRAVDALRDRLARGTEPPTAPPLALDGPDTLAVDEHGIARGGLRTPWVDAPVAALSGLGQPGELAGLMGTTRRFTPAELAARYPGGRDEHAAAFEAATARAVAAGHLLRTDTPEITALGRAAWPGA